MSNQHTSRWRTRIERLGMSPSEFVVQNSQNMPDSKIAEVLTKNGFPASENAVCSHRSKQLGLKKETVGGGSNMVSYIRVAESPFAKYDSPPVVDGNCCVLNDVELPFHNYDFLNRVLEICQVWGIKKAVANGDLLHHDSLSSFDPNWQEEGGDSGASGMTREATERLLDLAVDLPTKHGDRLRELLEEIGPQRLEGKSGISNEWKYARASMKSLRQVFTDEFTLVLGNHEGRMLRNVASPMFPSEIRRLLDSDEGWFKTAPYYWAIIDSNGVKYRATHPKNTSVKPASVASTLADKFQMNVIQAHNHLCGIVQSASGKYWGIEGGCIVDGKRLAYYSQRDTTRPNWVNGAVIIRDGYPYLFSDGKTDWKRMRSLA